MAPPCGREQRDAAELIGDGACDKVKDSRDAVDRRQALAGGSGSARDPRSSGYVYVEGLLILKSPLAQCSYEGHALVQERKIKRVGLLLMTYCPQLYV